MLSEGYLGHPRILPWCSLRHRPPSRGSLGHPKIFDVLQTQIPMLSGRSLGHPGILSWCPIRHGSPMLSRGCLGHPRILSWCTQAVYRIFQYYFLVLTRPKNFVVMITTSQVSRIFELIFYSTIVEVTYIHSHEKVCSQTSVLNLP